MKLMDKGRFSSLEQRIEQLVEGNFARLFAGRVHPREVAIHLARAIEDNAHTAPDGGLFCPNVFTVALNPQDHSALIEVQPGLATSLAEIVIDLASRAEMRLVSTPDIHLAADSTIPLRAIKVVGHYERPGRGTETFEPVRIPETGLAKRNPQLILHGTQHIPLNRPVMNVGRRHDNHIVIDDSRVSRAHAQIRQRFGHYVIYDLGSLGGTLVNNHRITEAILKPGDVISLAGVMLVYMEDDGTGEQKPTPSATDTQIRRVGNVSDSDDDSDPTI